MRIKGEVPEKELEYRKPMDPEKDEAVVLAFDPFKQQIVGKCPVTGAESTFTMDLDVSPERLKSIIYVWLCYNCTGLEEIHPKVDVTSKHFKYIP